MNQIFLGVQGVLSSGPVNCDRFEDTLPFEPDALTLLDDVCREAQAEVIICAPERAQRYDADWWTRFFRMHGAAHVVVVGVTPLIHKELRGYEVVRFREQNPHNTGNYVILDASGNYLVWQPVIKVEAKSRLRRRDAYEALRQLNPDSALLNQWHNTFGYGDLLTLVERPQRRLAA